MGGHQISLWINYSPRKISLQHLIHGDVLSVATSISPETCSFLYTMMRSKFLARISILAKCIRSVDLIFRRLQWGVFLPELVIDMVIDQPMLDFICQRLAMGDLNVKSVMFDCMSEGLLDCTSIYGLIESMETKVESLGLACFILGNFVPDASTRTRILEFRTNVSPLIEQDVPIA